jgi:hypothetical protein
VVLSALRGNEWRLSKLTKVKDSKRKQPVRIELDGGNIIIEGTFVDGDVAKKQFYSRPRRRSKF